MPVKSPNNRQAQGIDAGIKPRALLFDFGNTLVDYYQASEFLPVLQRGLDRLTHWLATQGCNDVDIGLADRIEAFNQERQDLVVWPMAERLRALLGLPASFIDQHYSDMEACLLAPVFEAARPAPDALPLLAGLKASGYRLGLVSNTPWGSSAAIWRQELQRHGLAEYFDTLVFCVDAGVRKPRREIFDQALRQLDVSPQHSLFIGDDPVWDVRGALNAGITPVLLGTPAGGDTLSISRLAELDSLLAAAPRPQ